MERHKLPLVHWGIGFGLDFTCAYIRSCFKN